MPDQIQQSARFLDLSPRFGISTVVAASPAAASETVIATVAIPGNLTIVSGVLVMGWAAYTIGTNGVSCRVRLHQSTSTIGATVADSGVMTGGHNTAGQLVADDVNAFDTTANASGAYCMTLTIGSGAAVSTVSSVVLVALVI